MNVVSALHIIGIIVWIGSLTVLARILADHCDVTSFEAREALQRIEHRIYFWGVVPGGLLTLGAGFAMLLFKGPSPGHYLAAAGPWGSTFHLKLTLVFIIFVCDHLLMRKMKSLHRSGEGKKSFFAAIHGMILVMIAVIVVSVKTNTLG